MGLGGFLFISFSYLCFFWMDGWFRWSFDFCYYLLFFVDYVVVVSCTLVIEPEGSIENNLSRSEGRVRYGYS